MKRSDLAMIILIAAVSGLIAYFVASAVIGQPDKRKTTVQTIDEITAEITDPNPSVFNSQAINPTLSSRIGESSGSQPFNN